MRTAKFIKLHNRAMNILEMIERCDRAIGESTYTLKNYDVFFPDVYRKSIKKYTAIKSRLVDWYADVMQRLIEDAMMNVIRREEQVRNEEMAETVSDMEHEMNATMCNAFSLGDLPINKLA